MRCSLHRARYLAFVLALFVGLFIASGIAHAQATSDRLFEDIKDHLGTVVIPGLSFTIPEGNEGTMTFALPSRTVDFTEPNHGTVSDRFRLNPYIVNVRSDQNPDGLPRRAGATLIPLTALEKFTPLFIAGGSDGDIGGGDSDRLTIVAGTYAGFAGATLVDVILPELPGGEFFAFGPLSISFDVEEPDEGQPGWHPGIISDYVDVINVQGFFLSSDDPADPRYQGPADGIVPEKDLPEWGRLDYRLNFESDVPEPASLFLLNLLPLFGGLMRHGRCLCMRRHSKRAQT